MSVQINSGDDKPHHRPLLIITGERPDSDVLEAMMRPYLDDPPWGNKEIRIVGYALGGDYRGWLMPRSAAETICSDLSPECSCLFHRNGVDAVRIADLQTAKLCWERWAAASKEPRQRKMRYSSAPRCDVVVERAYAKDNDLESENYGDPWRDHYGREADRQHARWLRINTGSCDDDRIPALIADVAPSCWLAIVDYWTKYI